MHRSGSFWIAGKIFPDRNLLLLIYKQGRQGISIRKGKESMIKNLQDTVTLANGVDMPGFGLGVFKMEDGDETIQSVIKAIKLGYRSIDTAALYNNEEGVGQAIRQSGIPREELFITTKVWNSDQGYETALQAFKESKRKLGVDYIDLYLVHWPVAGKYKETWRALEQLYRQGEVRAIGVSNFHKHHLEDLFADAEIKPMVNQVELHPLLAQSGLREYCKEEGIAVEAWAPLAQGRLLNHPTLATIAEKHGKSVAQIILRWHIQHGIIVIPKSIKEHRIAENADIFDFNLTFNDMITIDKIDANERVGPNPDNFNF